jgi:hypothetical protein
MPNTQYCEIVKFNLKAGAAKEQFLAVKSNLLNNYQRTKRLSRL